LGLFFVEEQIVTAQEYRSESAREIAAIWQQVVEQSVKCQQRLWTTQTALQAEWSDRIETKLKLAYDLLLHLIAARTPFDVMMAWQGWTADWLQSIADDAHHLILDSRKLNEVENSLPLAAESAE